MNYLVKKVFAFALILQLCLNMFASGVIAETTKNEETATPRPLTVFVNKKQLNSAKVAPYKSGKGYLVEAKKFSKLIKVKYKYNKKTKTVILKKGKKKMYLTVNKKKGIFKKKNFKLKTKTRIKKGTPVIDAVTVAKKFGFKHSKFFKDYNCLIIAKKKSALKVPSSLIDGPSDEPSLTAAPAPTPTIVPTTVPTFEVLYTSNFEDGSTLFTDFYGDVPTQTTVDGGANNTQKGLSVTASWLTCRSFPGMTLEPNKNYDMSFYIKGHVYQVILIMPDNTRHTICNYENAPEITDWQKIEFSFSTGDVLGTERDFEFRLMTGDGTAYLDELTIGVKGTKTEYVTMVPTGAPTSTPAATPAPGDGKYPAISIDPNEGKAGTTYAYRTTGLPICFINTNNKSNPTNKGVYQEAVMCIEDTGDAGKCLLEPLKIQIAVRGNSTAGAPKKPYNIKFMDNEDGTKNKQEVLGMSAHHKWNMLANYYDKSLLRNAVALKFASELDGLDYTPDFRYCEVVLNGKYVGNYMITEKVEIANNRVNIKKTSDDKQHYGYIVENDNRSPDFSFSTGGNAYSFQYKDPDKDDLDEDGNNTRANYIKNDVTKTWQNICSSTTYNQVTQYIDIDSFVDYHIVQDFAMPVDGYFTSVEMYKDSEGDRKLHMGPVWDYDLAFGNSNPGNVSDLLFKWTVYLAPVFNIADCRVKRTQRWNNYAKAKANAMVTYLDETAAYIKKSAELNNKKWPLTSDSYYPGAKVHKNNDEEVAYFKSQLKERIQYIDGRFNTGWY